MAISSSLKISCMVFVVIIRRNSKEGISTSLKLIYLQNLSFKIKHLFEF